MTNTTLNIPNQEDILRAYRVMSLTRIIDERMITLQRQGLITFAMSSKGEEACAVGAAAALDIGDWIYPQYREIGTMFWRGFSPEDFVHNMFGDAKDLNLGRQMPIHCGSRKLNVVTVSSPIATKIPHAAGSAYAMKLKKENHVVLCFFGEGATSEGDFHCGVNFVAVRKSPVIFFCRNNQYAISTPIKDQFASDGIAPKGQGYGIKTYKIDGNDFFTVYQTVQEAKAYCLAGNGPVLIEAMTYRMSSHSTSDDPSRYRTNEEVDSWNEKCPIKRLREYLHKNNLWDDAKEEALQKEIIATVNEAIEVAQKTPRPPLDTLIEHVYFETPATLKSQLDEVKTCMNDEGNHE